MQIRTLVVRLEFLTRCPAMFALFAMKNRRKNFELIMRCNSNWFVLHKLKFVMDIEKVFSYFKITLYTNYVKINISLILIYIFVKYKNDIRSHDTCIK